MTSSSSSGKMNDILHKTANTASSLTKVFHGSDQQKSKTNVKATEATAAASSGMIADIFHKTTQSASGLTKVFHGGSEQQKSKTTIKVHIRSASGLMAKDRNGFSDPYVTVQLGKTQSKKTKTKHKTLDPVWEEVIDISYLNGDDGIHDLNDELIDDENILLRVWDEDRGIKAKVERAIKKESDDFLGQIVFSIMAIEFNVEQEYKLQPRSQSSKVKGSIILKFTSESTDNKKFRISQMPNGRLKTTLKINLKHAKDLLAKDFGGTSDPFATLQLGTMISKRTKTQYKTLNPVWNEVIRISYFNSVEGLRDLNDELIQDEKLLVQLWDEDRGVKAKLDKLLTKEGDDFLGQISVDLDTMIFNVEREYTLQQRSSSSKVRGTVTVIIGIIIHNEPFLKQYYEMIKDSFRTIYEAKKNGSESAYLTEFLPAELNGHIDDYFANSEYNLGIKQFCMKNGINRVVRKMCHFNELNEYFINRLLVNRITKVGKLNAPCFSKAAKCLNQIIDFMEQFHPNIWMFADEEFTFFYDFMLNVHALPRKLIALISHYRQLYCDVDYEKEDLSQVVELFDFIKLIANSFKFMNSRLTKYKPDKESIKKEFERWSTLAMIGESYVEEINKLDHSVDTFMQIVEYCITQSLKTYARNVLLTYKNEDVLAVLKNNETSESCSMSNAQSIGKLHYLHALAAEQLQIELRLGDKLYGLCFTPILPKYRFSIVCSNVFLREFLTDLKSVVAKNVQFISTFQPEHIRDHVNAFILVKKLYFSDFDMTGTTDPLFNIDNMIELFQPFLLEYLEQQDDKFVTYLSNMNDTEKIAAKVLCEDLTRNDKKLQEIEKYHSSSVTDLFTIFYEILNTVSNFRSEEDETLNADHQLSFMTLIKNQVLRYVVVLKNEFIKFQASSSGRVNHEVVSCILLNNLFKLIDFTKDISEKLAPDGLNPDANDQVESLFSVLNQDISDLVKNVSKTFSQSIAAANTEISMKLSRCTYDKIDLQIQNLINDELFTMLDGKLFLCRHVLYEDIFDKLFKMLCKISLMCYDQCVVLDQINRVVRKKTAAVKTDDGGGFFSFLTFCSGDDEKKNLKAVKGDEYLQGALRVGLNTIVDFYGCDEEHVSKASLIKTAEYANAAKTIEMFLMPPNDLVKNFISTQNKIVNLMDGKTIGKINLIIEIRQDPKMPNDLIFEVLVSEIRDMIVDDDTMPTVEIMSVGADWKEDGEYEKETYKCSNVRFNEDKNSFCFKDIFEFRKTFKDVRDVSRLSKFHEFAIIVKGSKDDVLGVTLLNLEDIMKLHANDGSGIEFSINVWLPLKATLMLNQECLKYLEVLSEHVVSRRALDFVAIKQLFTIKF